MKEYEQEEKNENETHEPEMEYLVNPLLAEDEYDLEDSEYFEQVKEELEFVFEEDRIEHAIHPIPEGHMSLEDFHKLLQKKIMERYEEI